MKKKIKKKTSSDEEFLKGYHAAYALIYDKGDYAGGIEALRALGYDDNADVATLLGYASRKLGRYDDSKFWYERALAADPDHAVTWSYYGMWQAEQGNVLKAKDDLEKVRLICGTDCKAYKMLKDVIDGTATYSARTLSVATFKNTSRPGGCEAGLLGEISLNSIPFLHQLVPAKAGTQGDWPRCRRSPLDSRMRGNEEWSTRSGRRAHSAPYCFPSVSATIQAW